MSLFKRLITHATRHELSRFDELYLRHAGQECYLFGDGVTLKWMDLHQFADRPSILSSMGIYHREVDALRALYCVNTEPYWFWPYIRAKERGGDRLRYLRQTAQQEYRRSISQHLDILFLVNISNYVFIRSPNVRFVTRWYQPRFEDRNLFKDRFDSHDGTLRFQLALAIFLGFERAYLVGHDYTHFPSRSHHFYERGKGMLDGKRNFTLEYIKAAKKHIDLTTVTLDGSSETMHSVTYRDMTGKEPGFRENTEIVDKAKLDSLDNWCGLYSVYSVRSWK